MTTGNLMHRAYEWQKHATFSKKLQFRHAYEFDRVRGFIFCCSNVIAVQKQNKDVSLGGYVRAGILSSMATSEVKPGPQGEAEGQMQGSKGPFGFIEKMLQLQAQEPLEPPTGLSVGQLKEALATERDPSAAAMPFILRPQDKQRGGPGRARAGGTSRRMQIKIVERALAHARRDVRQFDPQLAVRTFCFQLPAGSFPVECFCSRHPS